MAGQTDIDLIAQVATPFTGRIFMPIMGLPRSDIPYLMGLKDRILHGAQIPAEHRDDQIIEAAGELGRYVDDALASARAAAGADDPNSVIGLLVAAEADEQQPLDATAAARICIQVLLAGIDTTAVALGNTIAYLLTDAELRLEVMTDSSLIPSVVEEVLRREPLINVARVLNRDQYFGSSLIRAGEMVLLIAGAAARDPEAYDDPNRVVLDRANIRQHISWGLGPHRCLGVRLAQMQLAVALTELHRYWSDYCLRPASSIVRDCGNMIGTREIPLRVTWSAPPAP